MDCLPRNVTIEALALSPAELRAFPRWYTNLLVRKHTDTITIGDVTSFVDNFGVTGPQKQGIERIFGEQLVSIDPLQFYIYLRLVGNALQGKHPRRELAYVAAPVPKPRSILAKKGSEPKSEMDSFMSLMTRSGNPRANGVHKRKKRVTFDSRPPQITEAAHRSMGELLRQSQVQEQLELQQQQQPAPAPPPPPPSAPQEPEPDQPIANNKFAHVNVDSVLQNGQSMLPEPPAPRKTMAGDSFIQQLTQNTAPTPASSNQHAPASAPGAHMHGQPPPPRPRAQSVQGASQPQNSGFQQPLQPNHTGPSTAFQRPMQPNHTGPSTGFNQTGFQQPMQPNTTGPSGFQQPMQPNTTGNGFQQPLQPNSTGLNPGFKQPLQPNSTGPNIRFQQPLQPSHTGPSMPSMGGLQPNTTGPSYQQPGFSVQPNQTGFSQPGLSSGLSQPGLSQPGLSQPGLSQPGLSQPGLSQPGLSQPGLSPNATGGWLGPHSTGSPMPPQFSGQFRPGQLGVPGISPQVSGVQPQQFAGVSPQGTGQPIAPGAQFLNAVQNPQYQYGQAYNMQGLRNEMPNW